MTTGSFLPGLPSIVNMSDAPAPWKRKLKPLPLPGRATAAAEAPAPTNANAADADDELDRLTSQYAAEAAASTQAVVYKQQRSKPPGQKGMAELRSEGLATALPAENK